MKGNGNGFSCPSGRVRFLPLCTYPATGVTLPPSCAWLRFQGTLLLWKGHFGKGDEGSRKGREVGVWSPRVLGARRSPRAAWMVREGFVLLGGICRASSRGKQLWRQESRLLLSPTGSEIFLPHIFCSFIMPLTREKGFFLALSIEYAVGCETLARKNVHLRQDTCKQQSPALLFLVIQLLRAFLPLQECAPGFEAVIRIN